MRTFNNILLILMITCSGIAATGTSVTDCPCSRHTGKMQGCGAEKHVGGPELRTECCCTYGSEACEIPFVLDQPPVNNFNLKAPTLKISQDYSIFSASAINLTDSHSRDGPYREYRNRFYTTPIFILNCSFLY